MTGINVDLGNDLEIDFAGKIPSGSILTLYF